MFAYIISKEIRNVQFEMEDLDILIEKQAMKDCERGELIDQRLKLRGKLDGLRFALETYQENE